MMKVKFFISAIGFVIGAVFLWLYFAVPQLERLPEDFYYEADVFSLDNLFDEASSRYLGEEISKTRFSYQVISKDRDILEVKNVFDVRQISGEKIFSVERIYGIDALTGRHVSGYGDKNRNGHLFAPKHLKKNSFVYWHVNYDESAHMTFQNEETINGLKVYRYETKYQADQTKNLGFLPGVPEERGVSLDIILQTWVEPVTGWLVKYEDQTMAYFYDLKSGQYLHPWNKFSNQYTDNSIASQARNAKLRKTKFIFYEKVVPGILILLGGLFIVLKFVVVKRYTVEQSLNEHDLKPKGFKAHSLWVLLIFIFLLLSGYMIYSVYFKNEGKKKDVKIGVSTWISNELFDKNIQGFKGALADAGYIEGENAQFIIKSSNGDKLQQRKIIQLFVSEQVDIIYSLTTPGTLIAKGITQKIPIIFSVITYPVQAGVIASMEHSGNNLVGTVNYVSPSKQYAVFEQIYPNTKSLGFVHRKGEANSVIQYNEFKDVLKERNIDVVDVSAVDLIDMAEKLKFAANKVNSFYAACDTLIQSGGEELVVQISAQQKKPNFTCNSDGTAKGSLIGNVANLFDLGQVAGEKAVFILQGAKPAWLRTENSHKNEIMINLKTANQLNLTVPQNLLDIADKIIAE